jgi:hypothetical protein
MTPEAQAYEIASAATNTARDALKAHPVGRWYYKHRDHYPRMARLVRHLVRARVDRYDDAMKASFFALADDWAAAGIGRLVTTRPPR